MCHLPKVSHHQDALLPQPLHAFGAVSFGMPCESEADGFRDFDRHPFHDGFPCKRPVHLTGYVSDRAIRFSHNQILPYSSRRVTVSFAYGQNCSSIRAMAKSFDQ